MSGDFDGLVAIVTGGASGIGAAVVSLLAIGAAMTVVYLAALTVLRSPELREVSGVFTRRLHRAG